MTDPRTGIFDAIRAARGKGFTNNDVLAVHNLLDALGVPKMGSNALEPSPSIVAYIKQIEGLAKMRPDGRLDAYMPTPQDVPTIGYGSTGPDIRMGTIWTVEQAEKRFAEHLAEFAAAVRSAIGKAPTSQGQFDAMVSLAYNIGTGAFRESTLLRLHKEGDYVGAKAQFGRWNKQKGQVLAGLTKRRAHEAGVYGS